MSDRPDTGIRRVTPGSRTPSRARGISGMVDFAVNPIVYLVNEGRNTNDYQYEETANAWKAEDKKC